MGFGEVVVRLIPGIDQSIGFSFGPVGIGALFGAATQEPISSLILVFEITRNYRLLPSLMLATVVATMISKKLSSFSIYNYQLFKEGIEVDENEEAAIMNENHVELCLRRECVVVGTQTTLSELLDKMRELERFEAYVVDENGIYIGAINGVFGAEAKIKYSEISNLVLAEDLIDTSFPTVRLDTPLSQAMRCMIRREVIELPVIGDDGKVAGCIHEHDLIDFYHREIIAKSSMLKTVRRAEDEEQCSILFEDEYKIEAIPCPAGFFGKSLVDLKLREKYNILVLAVREKKSGRGVAAATKILEAGDILISAGTRDEIKNFKKKIGQTPK
jgi:CIC family chloride channel protein